MSDVFPLAQMLATGVPAFVAGVFVGAYRERHQTDKESTMRTVAYAYKNWYDRRAPVVVTVVAIMALIGIWIGAAATITNGQQDRRADARDTAVQRCFDDWAIASTASSSAVRDASVLKDVATAKKDEAARKFNKALNDEGQAFEVVVDRIIANTLRPRDVKELRETLAERSRLGRVVERAQGRLARAQRRLDRARADNPVPEAPSEFCSVKP